MNQFGSVTGIRGLCAALSLALLPVAVAAQGSAVYTQSACMNARNGAGVAAPCADGSAVYYNPAGLTRHNGAVSFGITLVDQSGSFVYDTTGLEIVREPRSVPVPHGWAAYRLSPRLGIGFGVWAPYGLSIDWPVCAIDQPRCGTGFEGRFVGYDQSLRGLYFQPTVSWDLVPGRVSIGGGLDVVKGSLEMHRRLDLAEQAAGPLTFSQLGIAPGTDFADVALDASAWGVTGHIGALVQLTSGISIGARYLHSVKLAFDGTADFTQVPTRLTVGPLGGIFPAGTDLDTFLTASGIFDAEQDGIASDQDFSTTLTLPAQAVAGIAIQLDPTLRFMFDYQWTQWSAWDVIDVDLSVAPDEQLILDYQDASTFRLGADYALNDVITVRAGATYAQPAARDASVSPFLPDSERNFFSGGIHYRASERLSLDIFGMTVNAAARRGRVVGRESLTQTADELNAGVYSSDGQIFGAAVTYHLGGPR